MFSRKIITSTVSRTATSNIASKTSWQVAKSLSTLTVAGTPTSTFVHKSSLQSSPRFFSSDATTADSSLSQILTEEILEETSRKDEEADEDYDDVKKYITSVFQLSGKCQLMLFFMHATDVLYKLSTL